MSPRAWAAVGCIALTLVSGSAVSADPAAPSEVDRRRLARFEKQVDQIRTRLRIPGMSAVIVRDQQVLWSKGFGFADVENKVPATPQTLYHVASLTKTFAATLALQLMDQGKLGLDEPVSRYTSEVQGDSVQIKHLLSHTSEGTPGEHFNYNGNRFALLTPVLEKKTGKSFRMLMVDTFLDPLGMTASVPGHDVLDSASAHFDQEHRDRYQRNLQKLAKPYTLYGSEILAVNYPPRDIEAAAGLLSTVLDMARFDAAIDRHQFVKAETQERAWTPFVSIHGDSLPHGLGWFVQSYQGVKLVWHFGHWGTGFSATYLKVQARNLTLIMIANCEALSDPFYGNGSMETNAFASVFLRLFVFEDLLSRTLPDPDWSRGSSEFAEQVDRLSKQAGGKGYENTLATYQAVTRWLDARRTKARVTMRVDPKSYDEYLGRYDFGRRTFTAKREGSRFIMDFDRGEIAEIFPEAKDRYFTKQWDSQITFGRDSTGKVTYLDLVIEGGPSRRAKKIQ